MPVPGGGANPDGARRARLPSIQVLRAVAALAIVVQHLSAEFGPPATAGSALGFASRHLGAGIDLFFVISGFVMVHASAALFGRPAAWRTFLARRLLRIVPLYWAATALFLLVALAAPGALNSPAPTLKATLASLLFVPAFDGRGNIQPVYGLGWTLNYEMLFYVVFAAAIALPRPAAVALAGLALGALAVFGRAAAPEGAALFFWSDPIILEFLFGMVLALAASDRRRLAALVAAFLALALLAWTLTGAGHLLWGFRPLAYGAPAAAAVGVGVLLDLRGRAPGRAGPLVLLGDASYSLYLLHPFAIRAVDLAFDRLTLPGAWQAGLQAPVSLAAALLLAVASWRIFERPILRAAAKLS